jgi:hypothetical protein
MDGKYIIVGSFWNPSEVWGPFEFVEEARFAVERHAKEQGTKGTWDSTRMTYESKDMVCKIEERCNVRLLGD